MKNNRLTESERKLAVLLIRYMQKNPDAKHTADGIARWWIIQQKFEEEIERVEKVLRYLTKRGVLQEIILPQNQKYYKIDNQSVIHFIKEIEEEYI